MLTNRLVINKDMTMKQLYNVNLLLCIKAFHARIMGLNTLKQNSQGIDMDHLSMIHTS